MVKTAPYLALKKDGSLLAIGTEAKNLVDRLEANEELHCLVKNSELTDLKLAKIFFKYYFAQYLPRFSVFRPLILFSTPLTLSPAKRKLCSRMFYELSASEVVSISQPLAAAIGAGLPIQDNIGSFLLHLGEGRADVVAISLGKIVWQQGSNKAGKKLKELISWHFKKNAHLLCPDSEINKIVQQVLTFAKKPQTLVIRGKDLLTKNPAQIKISSLDLQPLLFSLANDYVAMIKNILASVPAALSCDALDRGILITGGLAQIKGWDDYLVEALNLPVGVVDHSQTTVLTGMEEALKLKLQF